jgi:hypothetical protein
MKQGILLIAVGDIAYLKMARNLLASIRVNDPGLAVAVATDKPDHPLTSMFDKVVPVPQEYCMHKGSQEWIKVKTHMYDLSPFERTIFLDTDMILIKGRSLSPIFDQLVDINWTMANTGPAGASIWADIEKVAAAYPSENGFWNYHSEFVYFRKSDEAKKYFSQVKKVFAAPKMEAISFAGARLSDELAFQIASMITGLYPHQEGFNPTFWWARDKKKANLYLYQIPAEMVAYSIGGNNLPNHVKRNYDNLASLYFKKLSLQSPYKAIAKKLFLKERSKI